MSRAFYNIFRSNTQITDDNIKELVNLYFTNSDLPHDLGNKSIND